MKWIACVVVAVSAIGCSGARHETFEVRGTLRTMGGPGPGTDAGTWGSVRAVTTSGSIVETVPASTDGTFVLRLATGSYVLKGNGGNSRYGYSCGGETIRVRSAIQNVAVVCVIG